MLKQDVIDYLDSIDRNPSWLARQIGITQQAVSAWPEVVPEGSAKKLSKFTRKLKYLKRDYKKEVKS